MYINLVQSPSTRKREDQFEIGQNATVAYYYNGNRELSQDLTFSIVVWNSVSSETWLKNAKQELDKTTLKTLTMLVLVKFRTKKRKRNPRSHFHLEKKSCCGTAMNVSFTICMLIYVSKRCGKRQTHLYPFGKICGSTGNYF